MHATAESRKSYHSLYHPFIVSANISVQTYKKFWYIGMLKLYESSFEILFLDFKYTDLTAFIGANYDFCKLLQQGWYYVFEMRLFAFLHTNMRRMIKYQYVAYKDR